MGADLFTAENVSEDALLEACEAALLDCELDEDGDVVVRDKFTVFLKLHHRKFVRFMCFFGLEDDCTEEEAHTLCNRINSGLVVVRAMVARESTLLLDWYIPLRGGITRKALMIALREFIDLIGSVGNYDLFDRIK